MKRLTFAKKAFVGVSLACALSVGAAELKECKMEKDKMSGCVELLGDGSQEDSLHGIHTSITLPYKNGRVNGVRNIEVWGEYIRFSINTSFTNGVRNGKEELYSGLYSYGEEGGAELKATFSYKDDEIISAKCANGKNIPNVKNNRDYSVSEIFNLCK
ncbi:hypothetical protein CVR55_04825 [Campylobacter upsaliensis]|nr:hypothetical protein [Campylobacter upsaliensis]